MSTLIPVDAIDLKLLDELQRDASRSNQAIAEAVHVSAATSLRRVKRLTDAGVIWASSSTNTGLLAREFVCKGENA